MDRLSHPRPDRPALSAVTFQYTIHEPEIPVSQEVDVQAFADSTVHTTLQRILKALGHDGYRFRNIGGNKDIVSDPDRVFQHQSEKPLTTIEFRTPWAFPKANLVTAYHNAGPKSKVGRAINQVYGYKTFNHHRYSVLTTYEETYFFQRVYSTSGGHLQVAGPFTWNESTPFTLLEAYTTFLLLVIRNWFYTSPTSAPSPSVPSSRRSTPPSPPSYLLTDVDITCLTFDKGRDRSRVGTVVEGTMRGLKVIFKILDETKHDSTELDEEVGQYQNLTPLQGVSIPRFLGYIRVWDMLRIVVMEDCGQSVKSLIDGSNVQLMRTGCLACLEALHSVGMVHGDVRLDNFVYLAGAGVRVVDFGRTCAGTQTEMNEEREGLVNLFRSL
ncbi:hypothetical protein HK104_003981 [Borealophlyctis nickersoniae]|nr:hypothetical protein HK104_003981 [Borealophlyctis nickersoniae]